MVNEMLIMSWDNLGLLSVPLVLVPLHIFFHIYLTLACIDGTDSFHLAGL